MRYWFGQDVLTSERLRTRLDEALAAAGPRYTREPRVDLPIAEIFDGLCRSPRYQERLRRKLRQVRESQRFWGEGLEVISSDEHAAEIYQGVQALIADVDRQVLALDFSTPRAVELPNLVTSCKAARARSTELWRHLEGLEAEAQRERYERGERSRSGRSLDGWKSVRWSIRKLEDALEQLESLLDSDSALAVNTRAIIVVGEAGTGKTHLLCDVARQRIDEGHPAILLLGQHFAVGDLWQQILQQADFEGRPDELLGALEAAAQASSGQALLCIDALNEAGDLRLWENHVATLLERVRHYPLVSIALSCRTSYEGDLLPANRFGNHVVRVEHSGFASKTQEAVRRFFRHYGLAEPDFPLTLPELGNPLFLKLMCISLSGTAPPGLRRGLNAVTSVFEGFLGEVEKRLAKRCDYASSRALGRQVAEDFAQDMLDRNVEWISFERAEEVTQELLGGRGWSESLLKGLIDEGVLMRDRPPGELDLGTREVVRFAYQRLGDHLCAQRLCARGLTGLKRWLQGDPDELRSLFFFRSGWLKALAIQVPEQFGIELHELVSDRSSRTIQDGFLQSLIWRAPHSIYRYGRQAHGGIRLRGRSIRTRTTLRCDLRRLVDL